MEFKSAIAALKKLDTENVDELVSSIEGHVTKLEEKSYETIGESRKNAAKARTLQEAVSSIAKLLGIEGEDLESSIESKVKELVDSSKASQAKLTELETRATAAEGKVKTLESETKLREIAAKVGADAKVLKRLLGDKLEEMAIDSDTVKIGDKPLKEYVEADEDLNAFSLALFPTQQKQEKQEQKITPKLPGGSPNGKTEKTDVLSKYAERSYGGIKALAKAKTEDAGI